MKKLKIKMEKSMWRLNMIISSLTVIELLVLALIGLIVDKKIHSSLFVFIPFWSVWTFVCVYKFRTFGKVYKWYRVVNDTRNSHGMVNSFVRFAWKGDEETIIAKDTKTGKTIKFDVKDLKEATAEYITKKLEQAALFFAGLTALVILGANVINGGHWLGTVGFAIISFVCFTVYKIQKDEY